MRTAPSCGPPAPAATLSGPGVCPPLQTLIFFAHQGSRSLLYTLVCSISCLSQAEPRCGAFKPTFLPLAPACRIPQPKLGLRSALGCPRPRLVSSPPECHWTRPRQAQEWGPPFLPQTRLEHVPLPPHSHSQCPSGRDVVTTHPQLHRALHTLSAMTQPDPVGRVFTKRQPSCRKACHLQGPRRERNHPDHFPL